MAALTITPINLNNESIHQSIDRITKPRIPLVQRQRTVKFVKTVAVHKSPSPPSNEEEHAKKWYTAVELQRIRKENRQLAEKMRHHGEDALEDGECIRGIEARVTRRARLETRARRVAVVQAVLVEQRKQLKLAQYDSILIRRKSLATSKASRQLAVELGRQDAVEVRQLRQASLPALSRSQSCHVGRRAFIDRSAHTIVL